MKKINTNLMVVALAASVVLGLIGPMPTLAAGPATVNLLTAANFAVLAKSGVSDSTPTSTSISGNVGVHPAAGSLITGLSCTEVTGTIYDNNAGYTGGHDSNVTCLIPNSGTLLGIAVGHMEAAYTDASTRPAGVGATNLNVGAGTLSGQNFAPGTYTWNGPTSNVTITGDITLTGTSSDVWIFQVAGTLDLANGKKILLAGGANANNVFWAVAGAVTLFPSSVFEGNILAQTNIAMQLGATLHGRALAQTAVTLIGNTISLPAAPVEVVPTAAGSVSAGSFSIIPLVPPLLNVLKVPNPLALPAGTGPVTYTYTLDNVGTVPASDVSLVDDSCKPVTIFYGDENGDSKLDVSERWIFKCSSVLTETHTNTVVATGWNAGLKATDVSSATVVVGSPLPAPLIHLVKKPSTFNLPVGGGAVTYTYTVTNPGKAALSNVTITDDKCTGLPGRVVGHPGDLNKNDLLESNETWTFTCQTNLTKSTTNTGTVVGYANGLSAVDLSSVTVIVAVPGLPNTGLPAQDRNALWNILMAAGALLLVSTSLVLVLKKSKI